MTVVGQHPGYEVPQRAAGTSSVWFRMLLVLLAVALVAGVGYLAYEAASDEPVAQPAVTFAQYPSYETIQSEIDAALLGTGEISSVAMVQAEIDEALMWQRSGASSVDIVNAQILQARADLLASPSSVAIVQAEINAALAEQARLAGLTEAWDAEYVAGLEANRKNQTTSFSGSACSMTKSASTNPQGAAMIPAKMTRAIGETSPTAGTTARRRIYWLKESTRLPCLMPGHADA